MRRSTTVFPVLGLFLFLAGSVQDGMAQTSVSGYIQTEWRHFDQRDNDSGFAFYEDEAKNFFTIRRGRIKASHKTDEGYSAAIQINANESSVDLLDAYLVIPALDSNLLDVKIGRFSKPNFSVLLSSSKREATERSQVIRSFYRGEREIGVMLTSMPELGSITPTIQFALFNSQLGRAEADPYKDLTLRLSVPIVEQENADLTIGGSWYAGGMPLDDDSVIRFVDGTQIIEFADANESWPGWGNRNHIGLELQTGVDILDAGRTVLRGEFLVGRMPSAATRIEQTFNEFIDTKDTTFLVMQGDSTVARDSVISFTAIDTVNTPVNTLALREQMGYYIELVQPITKNLTAAARYDFYDRNTGLIGTEVAGSGDRASSIIGFGLLGTFGPVRITGWYEMPSFAADEAGSSDVSDNKATIRFQYKYK